MHQVVLTRTADGNGRISFREFLLSAAVLEAGSPEQKLECVLPLRTRHDTCERDSLSGGSHVPRL
jgi:hypothetical protein